MSTIVFEQLPGVPVAPVGGVLNVELGLTSLLRQNALGATEGEIRVPLSIGMYSNPSEVEQPIDPGDLSVILEMSPALVGTQILGTMSVDLSIGSLLFYQPAADNGFINTYLDLSKSFSQAVYIGPGAEYDVAVSVAGVLLDTEQAQSDTAVARSGVSFTNPLYGHADVDSSMRDSVKFAAKLDGIYRHLITISAQFGVTQNVHFTAIAAMRDYLVLSGQVDSSAEAKKLITDAMVFGAVLEWGHSELITDELEISAQVSTRYEAVAKIVEEALFGVTQTPTITFVALISDEVEFSLSQSTSAEVASLLRDGVEFSVRLFLDSQNASTWTVNTVTSGPTRYENYQFNGFMEVGGQLYGSSETGLMRLSGAKDDGENINAKIRMGLSALGGRNMKRIQSAYLGFSSDGTMLVRVIHSDDQTGQRTAHTYKLIERGTNNTREGRVVVGRGVQAVYWDFEIANEAGADFMIDAFEIYPLQSERRVRGSSSGKAR